MSSSWLGQYLSYTANLEAPERFHIWTAIATVAAALNKNVYLDRRSHGVTAFRTYPGQLMVIIVADSGHLRKSTAVNLPLDFIRAAKIPLFEGKASTEGFIKSLDPAVTGHPAVGLLHIPELGVFLSKQTYVDPLIDLLTDLADGKKLLKFTTIKHGIVEIKEPMVTMLAATTPEHLGGSIPEKATGTGFMSRLLLVYARTTDRPPNPLIDIYDEGITTAEANKKAALAITLRDRLIEMTTLRGAFSFCRGDGTQEWLEQWYRAWVASPKGRGAGYPSRRFDHMLRVAMCLSTMRDNSLVLDQRTLAAADGLLSDIEADFERATAYIGSDAMRDRERLVQAIASAGGTLTQNNLIRATGRHFADVESFAKALRLLIEMGVVNVTPLPTGDRRLTLASMLTPP